MRERRPRTLLDFAIAASVVVVPLLFGMLLLVAVLRPQDPAAARIPQHADRYVSVRHVAALKTFEAAVLRRPDGPSAATPAAPTSADVSARLPHCRSDQADRVAAQLANLDAALLRFSTRANSRVAAAVGLDVQRWFDAAASVLAAPFEVPEYPRLRFLVDCADLVAALSALTRADARMLEALAWRGTEGETQVARWRPEQMMAVSAREVARRNPWNGLAGCIYLGVRGEDTPTHTLAGARSAHERLCALPAMAGASSAGAPTITALAGEHRPDLPVDDPRWGVPPSLQAMLRPLEDLRQPAGALYRLYTDIDSASPDLPGAYRYGPNRIVLDGSAVDVGFSVDLSIAPGLQTLAQKTVACYTGRQDVCQGLGLQRAEDRGHAIGHRLLEGAMVRMAAVAVVDVASGRIEALAGALSPCARQERDGPGRATDCDSRLPYPIQYRPDALLNQAVFHDAMPASTIKPVMASAFLADGEAGTRWLAAERSAMKRGGTPARDSLRGQLMRSDSARFLDRMFCFDHAFTDCARPWALQATARSFGWNGGCDAARADCGKQDLLFGRAVDATAEAGVVRPLATTVAYGRLMSAPVDGKLGAAQQLTPRATLDAATVRRCALGADGRRLSDDDWEKCRGGAVVDVVAEGWGQGHARASALGVAGMMATLAAAANGQAEVRRPHLVRSLRGVAPGDAAALRSAVVRWSLAPAQPHLLSRDAAEVILDGLSYGHRAGTSRTACEQVFDAKTCSSITWLAGKTGTPSFPGDGVSLDDLVRLCRPTGAQAPASHAACGSLRPYKWYVAAWRSDGKSNGPWTKVIAVLSERNWTVRSGQVHGAGDHGPNPAAEIAMQIAGRELGLIAGAAP